MGEAELVMAIDGVAKEFGCHSFKKTMETRLLCIPGGPPAASSYKRLGQSLGTIASTYVRDDVHGQHLASRVCALLDPSDSNFDVLCARFNPNVYPPSSIDYEELVPGYVDYAGKAPKFLACVPYLVAAVVHHLPFLRSVLPWNHPIWESRLITQGYCTPESVLSLVKENGILLGRGFCEITGMRSTGVPLYIKTNRKLDQILDDQSEQKEMIDQVESNTRGMATRLHEVATNVTALMGVMKYVQCSLSFPFSLYIYLFSHIAHLISLMSLSLIFYLLPTFCRGTSDTALMELMAGPNRGAFAAEVAAIVLQQLQSSGGFVGNSSNHSNNHNNNNNSNNENDQDNQNDHDDDVGDGVIDLSTYKALEQRACDKITWKVFTRSSILSLVENAVDLSKKTVAVLWERWFFSDVSKPNKPIPPWRSLKEFDFIQGSSYRKAKKIINDMLILLAAETLLPKRPIGQLSITAAEVLLNKGVELVVTRYLEKKTQLGFDKVTRPARILSMSMLTFYDYVNVGGLERKQEKEKAKDAQILAED